MFNMKWSKDEIELVHGDAIDYVGYLIEQKEEIRSIFMDPPDNVQLGYDGYPDNLTPQQYYNWLELLLIKTVMTRAKVIWLSYNPIHDVEIKAMVRNLIKYRHPSWLARTFIWRFTFGQYNGKDCASGYRPILRLLAPGTVLYPDEIKVVSVRAQLGDLRAAIDGMRVPDDVWESPRVVGNFIERRAWHPTQHPEALMEQIIRFSCSKHGTEKMVDLFSGSGTTLKVCQRIGVPAVGVEQSMLYCKNTAEELMLIAEGSEGSCTTIG